MKLIPGDILACYGGDLLSKAISIGTSFPLDPFSCWLPPSHVAIIAQWNNRLVWVESTTQCHRSCIYRGYPVDGVQVHSPPDRIADYVQSKGRVDVYRLHPCFMLDKHDQNRLTRTLFRGFVEPSVHYDLIGAVRSGFKLRRLTRGLWSADLDHVFCSELVAATLMRCGILNQDDPAIYSPGRLLRDVRRLDRYRLVERDIQPIRLFQGAA